MFPVLRSNSTSTPFATNPINRLESLFDRVFGDDGGFVNQAWPRLPVAMWEDDDHLTIEADLPGVAENDVDVTVHNGMLFIRGERKPQEGRRYLYNGQWFGHFERALVLPEAVNTDDVQATLSNGLLRVTLPKSLEAKPRKITLKTN
jgi:HSP20 family protein